MERRLTCLFVFVGMAACTGTEIPSQERQVLAEVHIDGYQTTWDVLYSGNADPICKRALENTHKVLEAVDTPPETIDFRNRDVVGVNSSFRAYYIPELLRGINESTFIYCAGSGSAFIPARCDIMGTSRYGCFDANFYGVEDRDLMKELDYKIRSQWPSPLKRER